MKNIIRHIDEAILGHFTTYKDILVLLGARQVGKTTLLKRLYPEAQYLLCDNESTRATLERYDISVYRQLISRSAPAVVIDEIQMLTNPGRAAKIVYDQMPGIRLIITGSSAMTIKHKTGESLAGRKIEYHLYPLTFSEYLVQQGLEEALSDRILSTILTKKKFPINDVHGYDLSGILESVLLYGLYPGVLSHPSDPTYLENLIDSAVFKDILGLQLIEERANGLQLLRLLAYQIGSLVNMTEIANRLRIDVKTVKRYIQLFTESYIIFPFSPYAKSGRDEVGKMPKIYFWDTGIRNALIQNVQPLAVRPDAGVLFENFIISECMKLNAYGRLGYTLHYWRTRQGSEVDMVLMRGNALFGVEIKQKQGNVHRAFADRYPHAHTRMVTSHNFFS